MPAAGALQQRCPHRPRFVVPASRTTKTLRPAELTQILSTGLLGGETRLELGQIPRIIFHFPDPTSCGHLSQVNTNQGFFEACEAGKGWQACAPYCKPDASFSAQAEPLAGITTLDAYADWMKALVGFMPDARYDLKSWAVDSERNNVSAYAVFSATHEGEGGPCPPTGKSVKSDYVYVMFFEGEKISHMTKIWHSGLAMQELGWV